MTDVLQDLQACSWRGISFPITMIQEQGSQDAPIHKKADRDGARVETTGLNPFQYSINAVFINSIARGKNEKWENLFPDTFLKVKDAWKDRSSGILIHPLFGEILCKPIAWNVSINADQRGGVFVDMIFMETTEDGAIQPKPSSLASAKAAALDLDDALGLMVPPPQTFYPEGSTSLTDFVNSLTSVVDQASLIKQQAVAKIDRVVHNLNKISEKIDVATNIVTTDPVTQIQTDLGRIGNGIVKVQQSATKLSLSLLEIKATLLAQDKTISTFTTTNRTTLFSLAGKLGNSISDLLNLNPYLAGTIVIDRNINVAYYT